MIRFLLDTNAASHIIRGNRSPLTEALKHQPILDIGISAVTKAELLFGVAKRGHPKTLTSLVTSFLRHVEVLPWSDDVAEVYGDLRLACEASGVGLAPLDLMIAAHAKTLGATLITSDKAFFRVPGLVAEDWAAAPSQK